MAGVLLILIGVSVVVLTMTDFGRERVRLFSLGELEKRIHGELTVERVRGNLLTGATLEHVSITDSAGQVFLRADTLSFRYSMRSLVQKHLVFSDVRMVRPVVLFDRQPGEEWNVERIFPGDTIVVPGDTIPGFGDWVRIEDLTVVDGTITVKRPWTPSEGDGGAVAEALSPDTRELVATAPGGGFQSISSFHRVDGRFPLLRLADPDSAARIVEVESLSTLALPFRPPAARVQDLSGRVTIEGGRLGLEDVHVTLPDSRLRLDGVYALAGTEETALRLLAQPVALPDLRWLRPSLPEGGGSLSLTVTEDADRTRFVAQEVDLQVAGGSITGFAELATGAGGTRLDRSDLRFEELDTRTIERLADVGVPVDGVLAGRVRLAGTADELDVDGWTTVRERSGVTSRIEADGVVLNRPGGLVARGLDLRFTPLRLTLARSLAPELPLDGEVTGVATLDGPLEALFQVDADLVHRSPTAGRSRVLADGGLRLEGEILARDLELRLDPLQSELVRAFEPDFPVGGIVTGTATVNGALASRFSFDANLVHDPLGAGRSHIVARGALDVEDGVVAHDLWLRFDPVQSELVRVFWADFAADGTVRGTATLDGPLRSAFTLDADLVHEGPETGRSHILAQGGLRVEGEPVARNLRLRFDPVQSALVRAFAPDFTARGTVTGRATVDGPLESFFSVDADLVHDGPGQAPSHVVANGALRLDGGFAARDLDLSLDPLRLDLVRAFDPGFPLHGTVEGRATLDGTAARLATTLDVVHRGPEGTSDVAGDIALDLEGADPGFDIDVRVAPLSLATVDPFVPGAGLRGSVTGIVRAEGTLAQATLDLDLDVEGGGAVAAEGRIGVGASAGYDLRTRLADFDASAVVTGAPTTALTGHVDIAGVGTDPATADAVIDAALVDSSVEGRPPVDSTRIVARLQEGLATVERGMIGLASARAEVEGSFGLVAGRVGQLRYDVTIDSLSQVSGLLPPDTGVVQPRPLPRALAMAAARADSARIAEDRLVEALATGRPVEAPALDTTPPLPRDSLAGRIHTEGVLTGNITRFDARGSAELDDVVAGGAAVGGGQFDYVIEGAGDPDARIAVEGALEDVRAAGFAFDASRVDVEHRGGFGSGSGEVDVELVQDPDRDYAVRAEYTLALDRAELRLQELALRFDTTRWTSTAPGAVRWGGRGIEIEHIELTDGRGGRIFADGRLPDGGSGELRLVVDSLPIGHLIGLLQDTVDTQGLLSLDATVTGSLTAPVMAGTATADGLRRGGQTLSTVRATFDYVDGELTARTEVVEGGRTLLEGDIRLPVDLALSDRTGPRLLDGPLEMDLQLDSLALETLPFGTDAVENLAGRVQGELTVRGTFDAPELTGELTLELGSARIRELNVALSGGTGRLRLEGDRIVVESLVAFTDAGPVRVAGTVALGTLTRPELDLVLTATGATVIDNEHGRVRADLDLEVEGPLDAFRVTGEARVESGEINVPEPESYNRVTDLSDPLLVDVLDTLEVRPELRPGNALIERIEADVTVHIERDTWLHNSDLRVEIYTPSGQPPLRITTNPDAANFALLGVVNTDRGIYDFAGRELELNSGSITFLGEVDPDPLFQLNAQHDVPRRGRETLTILVTVGGYLSEPRLTLSSNNEPPLPESDLLSYLAFGQESASLLASEGSGLMGEALGGLGLLAERQLAGLGLGALTDAFVSELEEEGMAAGLDVFRVRPGAIPDELNYGGYFDNIFRTMEIEGGEYIGERLFVSARFSPTGFAIPGMSVEYRTPSGFSWITAWEPHYLPARPSLARLEPDRSRVFGSFLLWRRRF